MRTYPPRLFLSFIFLALFNLTTLAQQGPVQMPARIFFEIGHRRQIEGQMMHGNFSTPLIRLPLLPSGTHYLNQAFFSWKDTIYCHPIGSGEVYKAAIDPTKDSLTFHRLDTTTFTRYNINCYAFMDSGQLFNIGGYGYWRWNGQLRKFNIRNGEWDIVPVNREIGISTISPETFVWHDETRHQLWVLDPIEGNEAIKQEEGKSYKHLHTVHRLDLKHADWQEAGVVNPRLYTGNIQPTLFAELDSGLLIEAGGRLEYWNLLANTIRVVADPLLHQSINRLVRERMVWSYEGRLYTGNPMNGSLDSLELPYMAFIPTEDRPYLRESPSGKYLWLLPTTLAGVVALMFFRRKKQKPLIVDKHLQNNTMATPKQDSRIPFTEVELSLLRLLIENERAGSRATTEEVNHAIGVSRKSLNNQKKVRSETIRSINGKYQLVGPTYNPKLILRSPNEFDARVSEYHLHPDEISRIDDMLNTVK